MWKTTMLPAAAWLGLGVMSFGQHTVTLLPLKKLSPTADALPRIAHPTPAQQKVNRSFALIDQRALASADHCHGRSEEGDEMFYNRSIHVTSEGPLMMSVDLTEGIGCGGVHPYYNRFTLTYDLHTGKPVHWAKLLMKVKAEETKVNPGNMLPFELPGVSSLSLQKIFSASWEDDGHCRLEDVVVDPSGDILTTFLLSPAPNRGGLSVLPAGLASAAAVCAVPIVLGKNAMDALGIPDDIERALLTQ